MKWEGAIRAAKAFAGWLARLAAVTGCLAGAGVFLAPGDAQSPPVVDYCSVCLRR